MKDDQTLRVQGCLLSERQIELTTRLADQIGLARLMPSQRISRAKLALHLRARIEDVEAILPEFAAKALLSIEGDEVMIAPLDRTDLMNQMEQREPLEKAIARAAAMKATVPQREKIAECVHLLKRSALVGDMEGYMKADRLLERLIGEAATLPEEFENLVRIKREFRRAWCAHNRLRDLNIPADLRRNLATAIAAGDADAAVDAVDRFLAYLRKSY